MLANNESYYFVTEVDPGLIDRHSSSDRAAAISNAGRSLEEDAYRPRQRRRQPPEAKKICRVCGDKAFSVNFNVVTCESCKAFFRRNALKTKETRCQTSGNCEVSMQTRRSCKKCRLKKCFEVGMIKEWIMSDEARLRKRQLIERNREKRQRSAAFSKSADTSDGEGCSRSNESAGTVATDYNPLLCAMPAPIVDYSPMNHWQTPPASAFIQQTSPSSSLLFQRTSTSAFQPPTILSNPLTPAPLHTMLPTEPAAPGSTAAATAPIEEMIRVPKTLLSALINQCHTAAAICSHSEESGQSTRPSVIVSNKSTPLNCICRCRCGAKAMGVPLEDDPAEKCAETHADETSDDSSGSSESDSDSEDSTEVKCRTTTVSLLSSKKSSTNFILNFDFGLSGAKLLHLDNLFSAFNFPATPIGRLLDEENMMPILPPLNRAEHGGQCASRLDMMIRRLVRFCGHLATSGSLKRKVLVNLVKACCAELVLFHSTLCFSFESDGWYDRGPNIRPITASELRTLKGGVYEGHVNFIRTFPRACKHDPAVILALCAMTLFNPARVKGKDRETVQLTRNFYLGLLTQYLASKFDADKARRLREKLLSHLEACHMVAAMVTPTIVIEMNEHDMEPLLIDTLGYED